jgi:hypothetical protein
VNKGSYHVIKIDSCKRIPDKWDVLVCKVGQRQKKFSKVGDELAIKKAEKCTDVTEA